MDKEKLISIREALLKVNNISPEHLHFLLPTSTSGEIQIMDSYGHKYPIYYKPPTNFDYIEQNKNNFRKFLRRK